MEDLLKQIWQYMGITQVWGAVLTLLLLVIVFFLKQLMSQRREKQRSDVSILKDQYADITEYVIEQSKGLIKAYLKIFENKEGIDAQGIKFSDIVAEADNELMKPLRKYQPKLDDDTIAKILNVHNILAQYYPQASKEAINKFKSRKSEFYAIQNEAQHFIKPDLILNRIGLVSKPLKKVRR
jgi:hypothetical protein